MISAARLIALLGLCACSSLGLKDDLRVVEVFKSTVVGVPGIMTSQKLEEAHNQTLAIRFETKNKFNIDEIEGGYVTGVGRSFCDSDRRDGLTSQPRVYKDAQGANPGTYTLLLDPIGTVVWGHVALRDRYDFNLFEHPRDICLQIVRSAGLYYFDAVSNTVRVTADEIARALAGDVRKLPELDVADPPRALRSRGPQPR